ncbi:hypothetical protein HS088_TW21G01787 [Tripterygium wilfordii]|uniref:Ribosomal protein-related n=1 Tax=Tripterygium wilfordii TaxID=458696 RepID=A0A7J7C638_TRIWF|nr:uncharacterized protein LOC119989571 [Tripterygium wilfordii]KAF5729620.1 hypothetical protein HS088_TW21G01787 [Tripterygium wilfordii]
MKQLKFPNPPNQNPSPQSQQSLQQEDPKSSNKVPQKTKLPTPKELIAHYESQGMGSQEASMKVIDDLQNVLYRVISSNNVNSKKGKVMVETSRKIDVINNRVAIVDAKLDSKPGYVETLAIGLASGAALQGIGSVLPHVVQGLGQIWTAVRSVTDKPTSS